jgi:hypothetical protein
MSPVHSENNSFPLVWIEMGRKLPRYLVNISNLTNELHPDYKQYLIHDRIESIPNCNLVQIDSIVKSEFTKRFEMLCVPEDLKDATFWKFTTSRFFMLYDFMLSMNWDRVLHLESDCLLLKSDYLKQLSRTNQEFLAYPHFGDGRGSGAVFLVNSRDLLKDFLIHIIQSTEVEWKSDMHLLGEFLSNESVISLPSEFTSSNLEIFDAGNIAPVYLGQDARNRRIPFSSRGEASSVKFSSNLSNILERKNWHLNFNKSNIELGLSDDQGPRYELHSLHIHSKRIPKSFWGFKRMLRRGFCGRRSKVWFYGHLDSVVLVERIVSFLERRILKKTDYRPINFR